MASSLKEKWVQKGEPWAGVSGMRHRGPRPGPLLGLGLALSVGWERLSLREVKTENETFQEELSFRSKPTPIKMRTQVLFFGCNTGACVQLRRPLKKADSSEHAVLGAISKS